VRKSFAETPSPAFACRYALTSSERTSRQVLRIADRLHTALAALRGEVEDHLPVLDRDVLAPHGGQPVALVGLGVLLAADPEEAEVEQTHSAGQGTLARHSVPRQVLFHGAAQLRQDGGELAHRLELSLRRPQLPALVVAPSGSR
jgi:hypothetical protein